MPYTLYSNIASLAWLAVGLVWIAGFIGNKKTLKVPNSGEQILANVLLVLGSIFTFSAPTGALALRVIPSNAFFGIIGAALTMAAAAFAIWARRTIGKNWSGAVITIKQDHELVETGPYALVRHPIYTGFFFASLGMAITLGFLTSFIGTAVVLVAFLIRMRTEEALMTAQFPDKYPDYKKRTKAFIPYIV